MRSPPPSGRNGDTSATMRTRRVSLTRVSPECPEPVLVEVLAHPQLRHHEGPEAIRVAPHAAVVLSLERLHGTDLEEAPGPDPVGCQEIVQRGTKVAAQPARERDHEPLLAMGEDFPG